MGEIQDRKRGRKRGMRRDGAVGRERDFGARGKGAG